MPSIELTIENQNEVIAALKSYPQISAPIFADAINAVLAVLKQNATDDNFQFKTPRSQRTGQLAESFNRGINLATPNNLQGSIGPTVSYANFVYSGTAPHIIQIVNKRVLANSQTGQMFGTVVHSPGSAANPFLDRILAASENQAQDLFSEAVSKIIGTIIGSMQ